MGNMNCSYDQIVVSKEEILTLSQNAIECLKGIRAEAIKLSNSKKSGENAADNILEINSYLYDALNRCLISMSNDWNSLQQAVNEVIDFDEYMAYKIEDSIPRTGKDVLVKILSGEYHNMADFVTELRQKSGNPVGPDSSFSGIRLDHDDIDVDSGMLTDVQASINIYTSTISRLNDYLQSLNAFVATDSFKGEFADAYKEYIESAHRPLIDRMADLFRALKMLVKGYLDKYDSLYCSANFRIRESELKTLFANLRVTRDAVVDNMYKANFLVNNINTASQDRLRLNSYNDGRLSYVDAFIAITEQDIEVIRIIEDCTCKQLVSFAHDADRIYEYSRLLKNTCGTGVLCANKAEFQRRSSLIVSRMNVGLYLNSHSLYKDDKIDVAVRDELLDLIKDDPAFADKIDKLDSASDDSLNGFIRYYSNLLNVTPDMNKKEAVTKALNSFATDPEWIAKVYRSSLDKNNRFLNDPAGYMFSTDNKPADVISKALARGVELVKNDDYGYNNYSRWGKDGYYDCSSMAVAIYMEGAGLPVPGEDLQIATHNMDELLNYGFIKIPFSAIDNNADNLNQGDILVDNSHHAHAETVIGPGRTIHATLINGYDDLNSGDKTGRYLENEETIRKHKDELETIGGWLKNDFGDFFDENYRDEDGLPVIGEIAAHRITKIDSEDPSKIVEDTVRHTQWEYVYRYTGGVTEP